MRGDRARSFPAGGGAARQLFQGELLMCRRISGGCFREEGYHVFLADTPPGRSADVSMTIEKA